MNQDIRRGKSGKALKINDSELDMIGRFRFYEEKGKMGRAGKIGRF